MNKKSRFTIRRYGSIEEMKADEYQYWQEQPAHVRLDAVEELSIEAFGLKNLPPDEPRLQRTIRRIKR